MRRERTFILASSVLLTAAGCFGQNAASKVGGPPAFDPKGQTKCSVKQSQAEPLIVEWPSASRGKLESLVEKQNVVAVRYSGCEMQVLARCSAPGKYGYKAFRNRKDDEVVIANQDELYANLPVGAASLEGRLESGGTLRVDMRLVGRYEASAVSIGENELTGECEGATHFISAVTVGAFDFYQAARATVSGGASVGSAGVGGRSQSDRANIRADGEVAACEKATPSDKEPPPNCGALVRIEVVPLGEAKMFSPSCPGGTTWDGTKCAAAVDTSCPKGMHFEAGRGCSGDVASNATMRLSTDSAAKYAAIDAELKKTFDYDTDKKHSHYDGPSDDVQAQYKKDVDVAQAFVARLRDFSINCGSVACKAYASARIGSIYDTLRTGLDATPFNLPRTLKLGQKSLNVDQFIKQLEANQQFDQADQIRDVARTQWRSFKDGEMSALDLKMVAGYAIAVALAKPYGPLEGPIERANARLVFYASYVGDAALKKLVESVDDPDPANAGKKLVYTTGMYGK